MKLVYIIAIVYAAVIGITIICIVIENIVVWRIKKLLIPIGVEKIEIGAHAALWKKNYSSSICSLAISHVHKKLV